MYNLFIYNKKLNCDDLLDNLFY